MARMHPPSPVSAQDLKNILQALCFAASGCMKAKPSKADRTRLRLVIARALKALKAPACESSQTDPADPVQMVADYVEQGGNWQALIAAITTRGRSGQTRPNFSTNSTKGKDYDNRKENATSH